MRELEARRHEQKSHTRGMGSGTHRMDAGDVSTACTSAERKAWAMLQNKPHERIFKTNP